MQGMQSVAQKSSTATLPAVSIAVPLSAVGGTPISTARAAVIRARALPPGAVTGGVECDRPLCVLDVFRVQLTTREE